MADVTWPVNVPSAFQHSGYGFEADSGIIRTSMDTGPAKIRRRTTAVVKRHKGTIIMTRAQFAAWQSWFENYLAFGSLTFAMSDPITGSTVDARIIAPTGGKAYSFSPESGSNYGVLSIEIEVLP